MSTPENHRFCEQCGAVLSPSVRFCEQCGSAVDQSAAQSPGSPQAVPEHKETGGHSGRTALWLWIGLAGGLVLMAIAGGGWWIQHKRITSPNAVASSPPLKPASVSSDGSLVPNAVPPVPVRQPVSPPFQPSGSPTAPPLGEAVTGMFPAQPFNGLQMEYRLEGVSVDSIREEQGFTTSRTVTGKVVAGVFRVSGRVGMSSGIRADVRIHLESGRSKQELPIAITAGSSQMNWQNFDLSVPVNSGVASLTIEMIGSYNVSQRRLLLTGNFASHGVNVTGSQSATTPAQTAEVTAAKDLADMVFWWGSQPWVNALKKSMPRGVTISMHAEPYDAGGWSDVEMREHHAPDSGFDPNVSPMVGLFRVSRVGRKIEWMEPVSGEYQPLGAFLKLWEINVGTPAAPPSVSKAPEAGVMRVTAGDFESKPPENPNRDAPVVVLDPTNKKNHVARITGPDEMDFTLPISVPSGTEELTIALRLLHPEGTKLIRFEDGRMPEGIRLRVRLLNDLGNSAIRDAVVRPTGQWREMEFTFYDLLKNVVQISVEAIWMEGPVYVDDVRISTP